MPRSSAPDFPLLEDSALEADQTQSAFTRRPAPAALDGDDFYDDFAREETPFDEPRGAATRPLRKEKPASRPRQSGTRKAPAKKTTATKSRKRTTRRVVPQAGKATPRALPYEITGIALVFTGAILLFYCLRANTDGLLTELGVNGLRYLFGVGAPLFAIGMGVLGLILIIHRHHTNFRSFGRGVGTAFAVFLTAVHLGSPRNMEFSAEALTGRGGLIGGIFAFLLRRGLDDTGAVLALIALATVALLLFTHTSLADCAAALGRLTRGVRDKLDLGSWRDRVGEKYRDTFEQEADDYYVDELEEERLKRWSRPRLKRRPQREEGLPPERISPFEPIEELLKNTPDAPLEFHRQRMQSPHEFEGHHVEQQEEWAQYQETAEQYPVEQYPVVQYDEVPLEILDEAPGFAVQGDAPAPAVPMTAPAPVAAPPAPVAAIPPAPQSSPAPVKTKAPEPAVAAAMPIVEEVESENPIEALEAQAQASASNSSAKPQAPAGSALRKRFGDGPLMPEYFDEALAALDPPVPVEVGSGDEDLTRGKQHVEDTLKAFRIDARVTDVKRGPVITRYEVQPAPGVRVATIANLDRDLARSLSAYAVRIEAPVPGRNVVGIEVPNKKVHLVRMRDVLEIPEFLSAQSKLAFVLGKDIAGQPKWADLTKMPHMLIAGATNSGKSVCLNSIIASILLRASPEEVKFSLIDPKRVELTLFRDIPHLYHPVVVEPKDAVRALRGAIAEMDRRYKLFATRGVRNIASYNSKLQEGEEPMSYLVIVIDELADLMMTAAAEFEKLICRIAQLARATGIHLIVATQRPSVNVITGVIKANIPARIAFAVASQVDSRTILDSVGAERLIGSGDMLFDANTGGKSVRIQGAYLSEEEVNRVVEVVKAKYADRMGAYDYGLDLASIEVGDSKVGGEEDGPSTEKRDDLYDEVKEFILRYDEMSASLIQRRFEIGYPRAGRIVDQLERDGILGPADGPKPRKVLGGGRSSE